ncbi:BQ5605_C001g00033 [Microbotryum silenes-dioicae]|uniref:BQ5605_C001g00033 protein n=1 Tax=Microbotryum silenes-dioicae TaxID=796604 RepID=A0A2X0M227_9BASI|nr:BQ5605_C001g00033 [Microbotryum silenes-dioicae]
MPLSTSATPTTPSAAVTDWQLSAIEVLTESGLMLAHSSALLFKPPAKLRGWRGLIAQCRQMTDTPGHLHNHEHGDRVDRDLSESPRPGRYIYKATDTNHSLPFHIRNMFHWCVKFLSKAIVVSAQKSVDFLEDLLADDPTEASFKKGVQKRIGS